MGTCILISDSEELESDSDSSDFPTEDMEVPITVVQSKVDISPFIAVSTELALVPCFGELQLELVHMLFTLAISTELQYLQVPIA